MNETYHVYQTPTGFGVFFQDDEDPFEVFHAKEVAEDFAKMMNWASEDTRQHREMRPRRTPQS